MSERKPDEKRYLHRTPILDELEKGPWPSFVKGMKDYAEKNEQPMLRGVLDQLEYSYKTKMGYWKGGTVGVKGYGAGVISRFSMIADKIPEATEFHTVRVQPAPGLHYSTAALRELLNAWEKHGAGLISMHGQTGNLQFQGIAQEHVQGFFDEVNQAGWDLGGAGATLRTGASCVGPARCEHACYDTLGTHLKLMKHFTDYVHRPEFPYKIKMKFAGCPNDCINSIQRADFAFVGMWKDDIRIDEPAVAEWIKTMGVDAVVNQVIRHCPTNAISLKGADKIEIDNRSCVRCMHCLNVMTKALHIGRTKGLALLVGGKGHLKVGNMLGSMMIPFIKMETEEDTDSLIQLLQTVIDWWSQEALDHERIGETIERVGIQEFMNAVGIEADPNMVDHPRDNPFFKAPY
jgi:dissimilatory sulfite reductase alpha subunit